MVALAVLPTLLPILTPGVAAATASLGVWVDSRTRHANRTASTYEPAFVRGDAPQVISACRQKLQLPNPGDGKPVFHRVAKISSLAALTAGGCTFAMLGVMGGFTPPAVLAGAIGGVFIGGVVYFAGLWVAVSVAFCVRFHERYTARVENADTYDTLCRQRRGLAASTVLTDEEQQSLRDAKDEEWRLNPINWLLQGLAALAGPFASPFFESLEPPAAKPASAAPAGAAPAGTAPAGTAPTSQTGLWDTWNGIVQESQNSPLTDNNVPGAQGG